MSSKQIPADLEDVFEKVREQVVWLHGRWIIYQQLFGTSVERVELLNRSASTFFFLIQETLMDDIQMILSKLADPAKTRSNRNLSLETVCDVVRTLNELELHANLERGLKQFREKCDNFKPRRNKKIAHFDYDTLMNQSSKYLSDISSQMIEDALEELRRFMNMVDGHFRDCEVFYDIFEMEADAEALVHMLKYGLRYEALVRDDVISIDDFINSRFYHA
jgi:hypothetical protein